MRSPIRRRHAAIVALSVGILITAYCGGSGGGEGESAPGAKELFFQRAAAEGPDPFTVSTAAAPPRPGSAARPGPAARPAREGSGSGTGDGAARTSRALPGSTPGLYGGTRSVSSCDVERQVRLLTEEPHEGPRLRARGGHHPDVRAGLPEGAHSGGSAGRHPGDEPRLPRRIRPFLPVRPPGGHRRHGRQPRAAEGALRLWGSAEPAGRHTGLRAAQGRPVAVLPGRPGGRHPACPADPRQSGHRGHGEQRLARTGDRHRRGRRPGSQDPMRRTARRPTSPIRPS